MERIKGFTKSEAWDMIAKVIEHTEDDMISEGCALSRIRGTYYGIVARGVETDVEEDDGK